MLHETSFFFFQAFLDLWDERRYAGGIGGQFLCCFFISLINIDYRTIPKNRLYT